MCKPGFARVPVEDNTRPLLPGLSYPSGSSKQVSGKTYLMFQETVRNTQQVFSSYYIITFAEFKQLGSKVGPIFYGIFCGNSVKYKKKSAL